LDQVKAGAERSGLARANYVSRKKEDRKKKGTKVQVSWSGDVGEW
jgi:hypothetical protein